jgi:hypothetical protein
MACSAWYELLGAWVSASRRYASAVMSARGLAGDDFENFRHLAEQARSECEQAERALRDHEQAHGCLHGAVGMKRSA